MSWQPSASHEIDLHRRSVLSMCGLQGCLEQRIRSAWRAALPFVFHHKRQDLRQNWHLMPSSSSTNVMTDPDRRSPSSMDGKRCPGLDASGLSCRVRDPVPSAAPESRC